MAAKNSTIPVKILYEAVSQTVTIELKKGDLYRGKLVSCEDNMNCLLEGVTKTKKDGQTQTLEQVFLRGAQIRLFQLPDLLRHSRQIKTSASAPAGRGRGKNLAGRAQAAQARR